MPGRASVCSSYLTLWRLPRECGECHDVRCASHAHTALFTPHHQFRGCTLSCGPPPLRRPFPSWQTSGRCSDGTPHHDRRPNAMPLVAAPSDLPVVTSPARSHCELDHLRASIVAPAHACGAMVLTATHQPTPINMLSLSFDTTSKPRHTTHSIAVGTTGTLITPNVMPPSVPPPSRALRHARQHVYGGKPSCADHAE